MNDWIDQFHPCEQIGYEVYCQLALSNAGKFVVFNDGMHVMYVLARRSFASYGE